MEAISPSIEVRQGLEKRGGGSLGRCYQCATCTSVCELATQDTAFPRRQMLWAQWGLADRLLSDPAIWLCHQCNDCSVRCPRDAKPGDVMQAARSLAVEQWSAPRFIGKLVAKAAYTWPLLIGLPILFWVLLLHQTVGLEAPGQLLAYEQFVPHSLIYAVYFTTAALVLLAITASGRRMWRLLGQNAPRAGSFFGHLGGALAEVASHKRFGSCGAARSRKWAHFFLVWGFVGAALASALLIVEMYGFGSSLPLEQAHPVKILANISAAFLVLGGGWLLVNRFRGSEHTGTSTAFDTFFLAVVLLVIYTGVLIEVYRLAGTDPQIACGVYVVHLGVVLCLFLTFPFSKFAHLVYRTLAMVHERMAADARRPASR